jgi:hypothetical protein
MYGVFRAGVAESEALLGYGKAILRAHGFSVDMLVELVQAGLATTKRERMVAGGRQTDIVRVRITEAGRQALAMSLILKRASASGPSGERRDDADVVVSRIFRVAPGPVR